MTLLFFPQKIKVLFSYRHPGYKPNLNVIRKSEEKLAEKIDELMEAALSTAEVIEIQ